MNTIIKSTVILALASVFFLGVASVTFAGHNTIIPVDAKVYENNIEAAVLDDFGSAGTAFSGNDSMLSETIKPAESLGSSSWY